MKERAIWNWKLSKKRSGVNFINILCAPFSYIDGVLRSFSLVIVWLCNFMTQEYREKDANKMLMKLTAGGKILNLKPPRRD